jgi:hypothetical protein
LTFIGALEEGLSAPNADWQILLFFLLPRVRNSVLRLFELLICLLSGRRISFLNNKDVLNVFNVLIKCTSTRTSQHALEIISQISGHTS